MSLPRRLWLVYCVSVLWIVPSAPYKTKEAECKYAYSNASHEISVDSRNFSSQGFDQCEYHIDAPNHYNIQLNFTKLFGFVAPKIGSNRTCVPVLSIDRTMDGRKNRTTINEAFETPYVFQSNVDSIRIIYLLNNCPQDSGFTLSYNFLRQEKPCAFRCDSSKCLPADSVCDGTSDCVDKSDEDAGKCAHPRNDHIPYIVIVAFVVLVTLFGVIVCFVRHNNCRIMSRVRQRHTTRDRQLRPQSQNSEVLVSSPTQEQIEQHVSLLRERYSQINSMMRDGELGYPPHVPRSKDGEEGYKESQKDILSHRQNAAANLECFRPPPNRTVHDTGSPPPYYSDSPNRSFDSFSSKTPPSLQDYNGCPVVIRCYSMSGSASGESHPEFYSNSHSRTHSSSSVGHGGGNIPTGRPPPRYENYNSNSVPTAPSIMTGGQGRGHCTSAPEGEGRGSRSSSVRSSPPDYHNAFSVTSANMYRSSSDKANV